MGLYFRLNLFLSRTQTCFHLGLLNWTQTQTYFKLGLLQSPLSKFNLQPFTVPLLPLRRLAAVLSFSEKLHQMGYVQEARENHVKKKVEEGTMGKLNPCFCFENAIMVFFSFFE